VETYSGINFVKLSQKRKITKQKIRCFLKMLFLTGIDEANEMHNTRTSQ